MRFLPVADGGPREAHEEAPAPAGEADGEEGVRDDHEGGHRREDESGRGATTGERDRARDRERDRDTETQRQTETDRQRSSSS